MIFKVSTTLLILLLFLVLYSRDSFGGARLLREGKVSVSYDTIQMAVESARAGDTINISEGVNFETLVIKGKHGTPSKPITVLGASRQLSVIDGSIVFGPANGFWRQEVQGTTQFSVAPYIFQGTSLVARLENGERLWTFANESQFLNSSVQSGIFYEKNRREILVKGINPRIHNIYVSRADYTVLIEDSSNLVFKELTIRNGGVASVKVSDCADISLIDLDVQGGRHGIYIKDGKGKNKSARIKIADCAVEERYGSDRYWSDFKRMGATSMEGAGIYIVSAGDNNEVTGCKIKGFFDGIAIAGDSAEQNIGLLLKENVISDIMDDGIELDGPCGGCRVFRNLVYDVFCGVSFAPTKGPVNVYRNIIVADKRSNFDRKSKFKQYGVGVKVGGKTNNPTENVNFYNNTIYAVGHAISTTYQDGNQKNCKYINNIFYSVNGYTVYSSGLPDGGVTFDSNLYFREKNKDLLLGWQSNRSGSMDSSMTAGIHKPGTSDGKWERHWIEANPELIGIDRRPPEALLSLASPAINKGVNVREFGWPDSSPVLDGMYDLGAVENSDVNLLP